MSGKETSSFSKKRSRRQTTDTLRCAIENENEDCKRFPHYLRKFLDENIFPLFAEIHNYFIKEDGNIVPIERPTIVPKDYAQEQSNKPVINAYCDMDLSLKKVVCKSPHIDTRLLLALNKIILIFTKLFTLRFDYCDLTFDHIELLAENLKYKQTVKELSLKGNPNEGQNFHKLIGCGLKILSLKFCGIDEKGLKKIAKEFLKCSPHSTLIHLDLSSNMVFDEGCNQVAEILRCDRTLQSLNLSDCKIGDEGFEEIIKSVQKFPLNEEEMYVRRKLRFEYFKLLQKEKDGFVSEKKSLIPDEQEHVKDCLAMAEDKMKNHPFTAECVQENGEIFCKGNNKLESLNVSYNHLTKTSFDLILKTLMDQSSVFGMDKGLNRVVLEGNPDTQQSEYVRITIEEFLLSKQTRRSLSGSVTRCKSSLKRRKSSAASSITIESK